MGVLVERKYIGEEIMEGMALENGGTSQTESGHFHP